MKNGGRVLCIVLAILCIPIILICIFLLIAGNAYIRHKESEKPFAAASVSQTDAYVPETEAAALELPETEAVMPETAAAQPETLPETVLPTAAATEPQPVQTADVRQQETLAPVPAVSTELSEGPVGTTSLNIINGGYVTADSENLYFRGDDGYLYAAPLGSSTGTRILNKEICYLSVQGGWLYFKNVTDNCLARMRTGGTDYQVLRSGDIHEPNLYGSYLYYCTNSELRRMNNNGTDDCAIASGNIWMMQIRDEGLYYIDTSGNRTLYRCGLDGSSPSALMDGVYEVVITDSYYIYTVGKDEHMLYAYDRSSGSQCRLFGGFARWLNSDGTYVYFTNNAGKTDNGLTYGDTLYQCRIDAGEESSERICEDSVEGVYYADGSIFYADKGGSLRRLLN